MSVLRIALLIAMLIPLHTGMDVKSAYAVNEREMQVVARSLRFIPNLERAGSAKIGVIVDPEDQVSASETEQVLNLLSRLGKTSKPRINPSVVPVSNIGRIDQMDLVMVTGGLRAYQQAIFLEASRNGILTVSADQNCVDAGYCVMWVDANPTVKIVVNRAAAQTSDIRFGTAFRMLVTER